MGTNTTKCTGIWTEFIEHYRVLPDIQLGIYYAEHILPRNSQITVPLNSPLLGRWITFYKYIFMFIYYNSFFQAGFLVLCLLSKFIMLFIYTSRVSSTVPCYCVTEWWELLTRYYASLGKGEKWISFVRQWRIHHLQRTMMLSRVFDEVFHVNVIFNHVRFLNIMSLFT